MSDTKLLQLITQSSFLSFIHISHHFTFSRTKNKYILYSSSLSCVILQNSGCFRMGNTGVSFCFTHLLLLYLRTENQITITEYDYDGDRQQMIGTRNENEGNFYL